MSNAISRVINNPWSLFQGLDRRGLTKWVADDVALKIIYRARTGLPLNLDNPKTFNEKLQWLKLHDRDPLYTTLVDKVAVKQWVSGIIGEKYITPTYDTWDSAEEIAIEKLPEKFVLKSNHDNGCVIVCRDKSKFDLGRARQIIDEHLGRNFFYCAGREWPYKNVVPCVFAEEYLETEEDLVDYKVMCFGGQAKLIQVHKGRFTDSRTQDFYTADWELTDISQCGLPMSPKPDEKPRVLGEMIACSEALSKGFPHVRVDWFILGDDLRFGEMTFYDASGFDLFDNPQHDQQLGEWIDLDMVYEKRKTQNHAG